MIATVVESMSTFEHTDAAFAPDAPALPPTEPALMFMRAPRRRLRPAPRQDHPSHATINRRLLVRRRAETAIASGQIRRAAEDGLMPIQRRRPQRDVRRSLR